MGYVEDLGRTIAKAFMLEYERKFEEAIKAHEDAIAWLEIFITEPKGTDEEWLTHKILEMRLHIHRYRKMYLESLAAKGSFDEAVILPTKWSADDDLKMKNEHHRPLSLVHNISLSTRLDSFNLYPGQDRKIPNPNRKLPPFSPILNPFIPPIVYHISLSQEVICGHTLISMHVKDSSNKHTLWLMQALCAKYGPVQKAFLKRTGELLPGTEAVSVNIEKTLDGGCRLTMRSVRMPEVKEAPDRGIRATHSSPRRFDYGGRNFVWKSEIAANITGRVYWETLYETRRVWPKPGSRTGKQEDETVGPRLCWSEKNTLVPSTLCFVAELDQDFQEHLLASQLARYLCRFRNMLPINHVENAQALQTHQALQTLHAIEAGLGAGDAMAQLAITSASFFSS